MSASTDAPSRLKEGLRAPLTALRRTAQEPVLVRVQLASTAVLTASWIATVALAVVAYQAGGSTGVALSIVARSVPGMVAGPAVGALVDRFPRRRTMMWAATASTGAGIAAALTARSAVLACVAVAVTALATMVFRSALSAVMPELVSSPADLTAANVLASAIEALGVFLGPALAGVLLAVQGPATTFAVSGVLFGAAAVLLAGPAGARPAPPGEDAPAGGWGELFRLRPVQLLFWLALAQTLVGGGLSVLYVGLSVQDLGAGEAGVGLLTAAFGLGGVLGSLGLFALAGSSRLGAWMFLGVLLWSVPLVVVPAFSVLPVVLLLLWLVGVGNVLFDVTIITLVQRAVPEHLLGRAFVAMYTIAMAGLVGGAVAAPALEGALGAAGAVAAFGLPLAAAGVLALKALRRLDASLEAPVRQVALLRALPAFALLPTPALERVALRLQRSEVAAGTAVVRQGDQGRHWYLVDQGRLTVQVDGREVATMGSGQAFGEIALLRGGVRTATVTARSDSVVWALSGEDFLAALSADGGGGLAAADEVAEAHLRRAAPAAAPAAKVILLPEPRRSEWMVPS